VAAVAAAVLAFSPVALHGQSPGQRLDQEFAALQQAIAALAQRVVALEARIAAAATASSDDADVDTVA
jgi:hypothetical protein